MQKLQKLQQIHRPHEQTFERKTSVKFTLTDIIIQAEEGRRKDL